ncbi:nitroreductase family protein [Acinetobacter sp.]|uniref:nitroreductase family protein n=1 Tax=Acinetobacter sp. TaxID=472 RepID=UPI0035B1D1B6
MEIFNKIGQVLTADITKDFKLKKRHEAETSKMTFVDQLKKRRSIYHLGKKVHFSQSYIASLIQEAVQSCPSAFNSQSTRVAVLFGDSHLKFWNIVKEVQKRHVPSTVFEGVEVKIDQIIAAYGTVVFYEDQDVIHHMQKQMPISAEDFPAWSEQTSGMAQFAVWTALADSGLGASLQHYNPVINQVVASYFDIAPNWLMRAQLVFGSVEAWPEEKEQDTDTDKFKIYA